MFKTCSTCSLHLHIFLLWEFLDQSVPIVDKNEDIPENIVEQQEQCEEGLATRDCHGQPWGFPEEPAPAVRVRFFTGKGVGFYKTHGFLYKELCTSNLLICIQ